MYLPARHNKFGRMQSINIVPQCCGNSPFELTERLESMDSFESREKNLLKANYSTLYRSIDKNLFKKIQYTFHAQIFGLIY